MARAFEGWCEIDGMVNRNSIYGLGNPNPAGFFQARAYGFDYCQTRVPGFGICCSGWRREQW